MAKKFSLEAIFAGVDRVTAPIRKIKGELAGLGTSAAKAARGLDKALGKGMAVLGRASSAVGLAGVASLAGVGFEMRNVMETGAELEKVLVRTGSAFEKPVRVGTAAFAELEAAARNVGKTTEFSAMQGAEALNSLATAGYTPAQSIAALPKILDFASAAVLDLGQASDITSDTLGAFNLRTADAKKNTANMARVVDTLTRAAADSTTNVAELFEGIRAGGAFAATAGASLEQYVGLQGVLANKGFKGAEAGTAIRNSFLHLTKQTKEAAEAQRKLGVVTAKNKDGSIDMMTTIGRFTKATAKLTRAKKAEAIATIFGAYTVGPFLALMDAGEETIRKFTAGVEGAAGVTQEMSAAMRESKSAKIARFFNVIEGVRLTVFAAIAPTVMQIAESVGAWVTANEKLIGTKAAEWATKLKDALPEIWDWTVKIATATAGYVAVAFAVKTVTLAIEAYEIACKVATAAAWLWNKAVIASRAIANRATLATLGMKAAQVATRVATWLSTAAQWAYSTSINASTAASVRLKIAEWATRIAQLASAAATWIATAAQTGFGVVVWSSISGLVAFKAAAFASVPAIGATVVAMAPLLITFGALAAAVLAVVAAYKQFSALSDELAGSGGITGTLSKMWEMGTFDPFKAHDAAMNDKARERRDESDEREARGEGELARTQVISPQARAATATAEAVAGEGAHVKGKITVGLERGTRAKVEQPKGSKVPIELERSGAFP
jgi:TP901 family phage tail tape measure protein